MQPGRNEGSITLRALLVGVGMAAFLGLGAGYTEMMVRCSPMANDFTAAAALYLLVVLLILIQLPLRLLGRRFGFSKAELVTIYVIMLVAAGIPTRGLVQFLGPTITGAQYYATDVNKWHEYFVPYLSKSPWLAPQNMEAIRAYYDGLRPGDRIPWLTWARPTFMWLLFCVAMSMAMLCVAVILRRQWMENERLVYPMMQVPMDVVRSSALDAEENIWKSPLLWIGVAIPVVLLSLRALSHDNYLPNVFGKIRFATYFRLLERTILLEFRFSPITLGFMYFVRLDVLLGLWVSSLAIIVLFGFMKFLGLEPVVPRIGIWSYDTIRAFTGAGAMLVFMGVILWRARRHIYAVVSSLFSSKQEEESKEEILSYRAAVILLLICSIFIFAWLVWTGMAMWQAALYMVLALIIYAALTRLVAEAGLPMAMTPVCAADFMVGLFGSRVFTRENLVGIGLTYPYHSEMRTSVMALCANGLKIFHETVTRRRRLLVWGILAGVVLSYLASMTLMIYFPYRRGGLNLDRFAFETAAKYPWQDATRRIEDRHGPVWKAYPWMAGGAAVMALLLVAIHYFPNWPLHPIGLITGFHWAGRVLFSSALYMWILKGVLLKYGGPWLFRRVRPFFVGMVLGEIFTAGLWATIDVFTGATYNMITPMF